MLTIGRPPLRSTSPAAAFAPPDAATASASPVAASTSFIVAAAPAPGSATFWAGVGAAAASPSPPPGPAYPGPAALFFYRRACRPVWPSAGPSPPSLLRSRVLPRGVELQQWPAVPLSCPGGGELTRAARGIGSASENSVGPGHCFQPQPPPDVKEEEIRRQEEAAVEESVVRAEPPPAGIADIAAASTLDVRLAAGASGRSCGLRPDVVHRGNIGSVALDTGGLPSTAAGKGEVVGGGAKSYLTMTVSSLSSWPSRLPSLLLTRLHLSLTTLPPRAAWLFTFKLLAAGALPLALCGVWANAMSLPHAHLSPAVLIKVFFAPCLAEELLWRALLNPHPQMILLTGRSESQSQASAVFAPSSRSKEDTVRRRGDGHMADQQSGGSATAYATDLRRRGSSSAANGIGDSSTDVDSSAASSPRPIGAAIVSAEADVMFWAVFSTALYVAAHPALAYLVRPAALPLFSHPGFLLACAVLGAMCIAAFRHSGGSVWPAVFLHWVVVGVWLSLGGRHRAPF